MRKTIVQLLILVALLTTSTNAAWKWSGSVAGRVVGAEAGLPVADAMIILSRTFDRTVLTAMTTADGKFTISVVEPGRYTLTARKTGYVTTEFGEKRAGGPGTTLSIAGDQNIADLVLTLVPSGVLAGTIRDSRGDAAASVEVTALRIDTALNSPAPVARTDSVGRFRLFDLVPGEYIVRAGTRTGSAISGNASAAERAATAPEKLRSAVASSLAAADSTLTSERVGWLPRYYPGTSDPQHALALTVSPGSSRIDVDFVYDVSPVAEVQGRVRDPRGASTGPLTVSVVATERVTRQWGEVPMRARVLTEPDGTFLISGLPSGRYNLIATLNGPSSTGGPLRTGMVAWDAQRVSLTAGTRSSGIDLILKSSISLSGSVAATSDPALRDSVAEITVRATEMADDIAVVAATPGDKRVVRTASDGSFRMQGLLPGRYEVSVTVVAPPFAFATAMMLHGTDVLDSGLAVGDTDVSDLKLVLAPRAASISGTIKADSLPLSDCFVVVFPADSELWSPLSRRIRSVRPSTNGQFQVDDLPPGSYLLGAVFDMDQASLKSVTFLTAIRSAAVPIVVAPGQRLVQNLLVK